MLQQHIDKEIIDLALFAQSTSANVLLKHWDLVLMDWTYLMYILEDYQIIISLLQEKWTHILQQAEWENSNYKNIYDNLLKIDTQQATRAWDNYQQMKQESKWIEQMIFFLKKMICYFNNLNALAKNHTEISNFSQLFIIYFAYKKTNKEEQYAMNKLINEIQNLYILSGDLLKFAKAQTNLYYIYPYTS